ncbi:MAG TPA: hypothetical protein VNU26_03370 [Mycobacteriales bacterium]|nr:hypothetical protein [Mycobacteriales bacterium]
MSTPDPDLTGAGLSATGTTADDLDPGDESPGTTYASPTGTGRAGEEVAGADDAQPGATAEGDVEGG